MKKSNGFVIGHGRSLIDGAPIVVIATVKSRNVKTGDMVQTWVLRQDMLPTDAVKSGDDYAICGDCPHRGTSCYVEIGRAPNQVFKAFARGSYPDISNDVEAIAAIGRGRKVRIGAYGDPMAAPASIWENLCRDADGNSGYSHQWLNQSISANQRDRIMALCMASCDSDFEKQQAKALGYRTFRVRDANEQLTSREIACPASDEGGNRITCEACVACNGNRRFRAADIAIIVHGASKAKFRTISIKLENYHAR